MIRSIRISYSHGAFSLWKAEAMMMAMIIIPYALAPFIAIFFYPVVSLILAFLVFGYIRRKNQEDDINYECMVLPYIMARTLVVYSLILIVVIFYLLGNWAFTSASLIPDKSLHAYYFPVLIISPILVFTSLRGLNRDSAFFTLYKVRYGDPIERSIYGAMQDNEIHSLLKRIVFFSGVFTLVSWGYFIFLYNQEYISGFDKLVFSGVPIIVCLLLLVFASVRCLVISMSKEYLFRDSVFKLDKNYLRYLVISGDSVLVEKNSHGLWDTPFGLNVPYTETVSIFSAKQHLSQRFNLKYDEIRELYRNVDTTDHSGVWHYACFVEDRDNIKSEGEWIDGSELVRRYYNHQLYWPFARELRRILRWVMTINTYRNDGSRRYGIKGYVPKFSLSEIRKIDIPINDMQWAMRSINNVDNRFFRFKKYWYKYVEGLID